MNRYREIVSPRVIRWGAAASALAMALALPQLARAQATGEREVVPVQSSDDAAVDRAAQDAGTSSEEIVVTGTLLRGVPPVGSNLISVGEERIAATGATTANELLASVPQVSNLFNTVPNSRLTVSATAIQVVRPNLRNLSREDGSSASTLVLIDGHRVANVGVTQNAVDPDLIPAVAIERVEVVTDGGSSTYGADAVGGVINFITRKRYDGLKVSGRYGFADNYYQVEASGIVGKDWGSGSIFAAYTYQHNDSLFGRDRDYIRQRDYTVTPPSLLLGTATDSLRCSPSNVRVGSGATLQSFNVTGSNPTVLAPGAAPCDQSDDSASIPRATRHGALVGLHQELADWLTVDLRGFYGERTSHTQSPFRDTVTVTGGSSAANPRQFYYTPTAAGSTANQTVYFNFAPVLGRNADSEIGFKAWGANAEFKADLNENWGLRTLFNYSRSNSEYHLGGINTALRNAAGRGTTAATAVNFYNPSAADLALINAMVNQELAGQGKDDLFNARAIVDGTLFTLPGGDVKIAAGYEYLHEGYQQRIVTGNNPIGFIDGVPFVSYSRRVHSLFGEAQVPIFGADNRVGGIYSLIVAGSVRYDRFSDFGSTTNPKVGITYKPVSWLGLRGNYSTSFNAPSPVDQLGSRRNAARFDNLNAFVRQFPAPDVIAPGVVGTFSLGGGLPDLRPQTATIYSFGFDIDPPFLEGFHASASYYNVKFKDVIAPPTPNSGIFVNFPNNVTADVNGLTLGQLQEFALRAPNGTQILNDQILGAGKCPVGATAASRCNVYEIVDFRTGNYGTVKVQGIDFSANYRMTTGFGGVDAGISGNYQLKRRTQSGVGAPVIDALHRNALFGIDGSSRLQLQATLGAEIGTFRAQASLNHTAGFQIARRTQFPQDRVGAFNTVNLYLKYGVPSESFLLSDLELTLNVNNVFDQDPPFSSATTGSSNSGYINGFTLGRLVQFGISKKF